MPRPSPGFGIALVALCCAVLLAACGSKTETYPFRLWTNVEDATKLDSETPSLIAEGYRFDFDSPDEPQWVPVRNIASMARRDGFLILSAGEKAVVSTPPNFRLKAEEIAEINIHMRISEGNLFLLSWGNEPHQTVPVTMSNPREFSTYTVFTRRLKGWEDTINWVAIIPTDSPKGARAEIDYIEFKPITSYADSAIGTAEHWIANERRNVLYVHSPSELVFRRTVPENARLDFGVGIVSPKSPTRFVVVIKSGSDETEVFSERVTSDEAWTDASVDLGRWSGQRVEVAFRTSSDFRGAPALWSNPIMYKVEPERKNVVVYLIDALRPDHLSCYGYHRMTSPNIDSFAENGVMFMNAYSHASRTVESVPSIFTSLYTSTHGVKQETMLLGDAYTTLAEAMRGAGLTTAAFSTNVNAGLMTNVDQGFDYFYDAGPKFARKVGMRALPEEEVSQWLRYHKHQPFFAYIHTCEPHAPYEPPEQWKGLYDEGYTGPITGQRLGPNGFFTAETPEEIRHVISMYDEDVTFGDYMFGKFLEMLEREQILDNTLIFVVADHGEELYDHGWWVHAMTLYEEVIRVPMILGGDKRLPKDERRTGRVGLIDVMPTALSWVGAELPNDMQGIDMLSDSAAGRPDPDRVLLAENYEEGYEALSILNGQLKFIYSKTDVGDPRMELYDLSSDPKELNNLAPEDERASFLRAKLLSEMDKKSAQSKGRPEEKELDPETVERLRALGYVD
jgi:arylsulfatase A-like enzyme